MSYITLNGLGHFVLVFDVCFRIYFLFLDHPLGCLRPEHPIHEGKSRTFSNIVFTTIRVKLLAKHRASGANTMSRAGESDPVTYYRDTGS